MMGQFEEYLLLRSGWHHLAMERVEWTLHLDGAL